MAAAALVSFLALGWFGSSSDTPAPAPPACDEEKEYRRTSDGLRVWTPEELAPFVGDENEKRIYIAAMGHVFDVTEGKQHYAPKRAYSHFAGRDSSKSFVTGDSARDRLTDDLSGLDDEELESVASWYKFYDEHEVYKRVGVLEGRWYNHETGKPEQPFPWERLEEKKARVQRLKELFPDCNSRWSQNTGSEVWCTKLSGGVSRDWVGVPRKFKPEDADRERCACVRADNLEEPGLSEYEDCPADAERCKVVKK